MVSTFQDGLLCNHMQDAPAILYHANLSLHTIGQLLLDSDDDSLGGVAEAGTASDSAKRRSGVEKSSLEDGEWTRTTA